MKMKCQEVQEHLRLLRKIMAERKVDYYLIPTADFHGSEYVSDYFKVREYFSGFTGSAGTLLVWQEGAALWTDGRYFIQAARELEGTGVVLMKMREEGVPTLEQYLEEHMKAGMTLGFDGRVVTASEGLAFEKKLVPKEITLRYDEDLSEKVWTDRPAFPAGDIWVLPEETAGESAAEKMQKVRAEMEKKGADGFFLTKLDDIMWLCNLRGCDVECNPVAMSYAYVTGEEAFLFLQKEALKQYAEIEAYLAGQQIRLREYGEAAEFLKNATEKKILLDRRYCSYAMYKLAGTGRETVAENSDPVERLKAVKNPVELANMERIYLKDSVALTKFLFWLKTNIGKTEITEISAADKLEELRREIPEFLDLSFPTIAGYGSNAAMMHYEATPENHAVLKPEGFLLVDSGGQYLGGTTDVTRTISLGALTEEERYHYTLVAAGMLQMTNTRFLYGCTGRNLDIQAREPLWEKGLDYKCGTGHGVGYILNVHEGPHSLRWQYNPGAEETVFEEGMDVTNEPGVYIEGKHGIRIENVMVAKKAEKNEYGQFMKFDTLTWVPLDRDALEEKYLSERQREWARIYQKMVYEKVSPFLTEEEREWLRRETE